MIDHSTYSNEEVWKISRGKIGITYSHELRQNLESLTGRVVRVMGDGYVATADYRPERLNLLINDNVIMDAYFG